MVTMWLARQNFLVKDASQSSHTKGRCSKLSPMPFAAEKASKVPPSHGCCCRKPRDGITLPVLESSVTICSLPASLSVEGMSYDGCPSDDDFLDIVSSDLTLGHIDAAAAAFSISLLVCNTK